MGRPPKYATDEEAREARKQQSRASHQRARERKKQQREEAAKMVDQLDNSRAANDIDNVQHSEQNISNASSSSSTEAILPLKEIVIQSNQASEGQRVLINVPRPCSSAVAPTSVDPSYWLTRFLNAESEWQQFTGGSPRRALQRIVSNWAGYNSIRDIQVELEKHIAHVQRIWKTYDAAMGEWNTMHGFSVFMAPDPNASEVKRLENQLIKLWLHSLTVHEVSDMSLQNCSKKFFFLQLGRGEDY